MELDEPGSAFARLDHRILEFLSPQAVDDFHRAPFRLATTDGLAQFASIDPQAGSPSTAVRLIARHDVDGGINIQ